MQIRRMSIRAQMIRLIHFRRDHRFARFELHQQAAQIVENGASLIHFHTTREVGALPYEARCPRIDGFTGKFFYEFWRIGCIPVFVFAFMRMQCGDNHIRPARSIANALQNCFLIRFVHVIANIGAVTALDLQVSAHGRTELERIFCRWLPRFNLAYFFETFIGAQHRINSTKLFKLLARQHIRTPPTQRAQPRTRHHIGILVACQSALGPGRRATRPCAVSRKRALRASQRLRPTPQGMMPRASAASIVSRQPCGP